MASAEGSLRVELAWSPAPGQWCCRVLELPAGSTVADALAALPEAGGMDAEDERIGLWGHRARRDERLTDGDRVEVYRPLSVDPMEARRRRQAVTGRRIVSRHRPAKKE